MSRTIAVIGLGVMGRPIALHLSEAGYSVRGYNRGPTNTTRFVQSGGAAAPTLSEAIVDADVIITVLPDAPEVSETVCGSGGIAELGKRGAVWIDMSTISANASRRLATVVRERGVHAVDAPMSGGEIGALNRALSIMVGGTASDFDLARPVLDVVGSSVVHVGDSGSGQLAKAANQLMVAGHIQALAEAISFLEAHEGISTSAALRVIGGGLAGSRVLDVKADSMLTGDFAPGFRIALHQKDLRIFAGAADEASVACPLADLMIELFAEAVRRGDGELDHSAVYRLAAEGR